MVRPVGRSPGWCRCGRGRGEGEPRSGVSGPCQSGVDRCAPGALPGGNGGRRHGEVPVSGRVPKGRRVPLGMTDRGGGAAPGRRWTARALALPAAEQGAAQPTQRGEERDAARPGPRAPGAAVVRGVTRDELAHQRRRLGRLPLWDRGAPENREMAVEARTGRAATARDRRDPGPAAHRYLFHVTPHPYESTRPGQGNPIAPSGHSCIEVTGFTFPIRGLTNTRRLLSESDRFQGELNDGLRGGPR